MTEQEFLAIIIIIAGAIGGLLCPIHQHQGQLVWPVINIRKWTFRAELPASVIIGAVVV